MEKELMDEVLREALKADKRPSETLNKSILDRAGRDTSPDKFSKKFSGKIRRFPGLLTMAASFVIITVVCVGVFFQPQVKAMMEHLFGNITEVYVADDVQKKELAEDEVYRVGQMISRQGIGITLEEVLVDANKVAYCIKIRSSEEWGPTLNHSGASCHVYINGTLLSGKTTCLGCTADGHTETWVEEVNLNPDMSLNGNVDVAISVNKVFTVPQIEDHWNFKTTVNVNAANRHTMRDLTTTTMKLENGDVLVLHQVIATSTDCKLYFTYTPGKKASDFDLSFDGVDNLGNPVSSSNYQMEKIKGTKKYRLIVTIDNALRYNVNKLELAPYHLDKKTYDYYKAGESFSVVLR